MLSKNFSLSILFSFALLLLGCIFLSGSFRPALAAGESFTLEEAVSYGLDHNPRLKSAELSVQRAATEVKGAAGNFMPHLSASLSLSRLSSLSADGPTETDYLDQYSHYASLKLSQTLFSGYRLVSGYQRVLQEKLLAEVQAKLQRQNLEHEIQFRFIQLLQARSERQAAKLAVERGQANLAASRAYFERQLTPYADVLQAEVDLEEAVRLQIMADLTIDKARIALHLLLCLPMAEPVAFVGDLKTLPRAWNFSLDQSLSAALEQRPELEALEHKRKIAASDEKIACSQYFPRLDVSVSYADSLRDYSDPGYNLGLSYDRDQENRYWTAGLNLQWNLFDGGTAYHKIKSYQLQQEILDRQLQETNLEISAQVRKSYIAMQESRRLITSAEKSTLAGREFYESERERLRLGIGTLPRLFDAQVRLSRAEAQLNRALGDLHIARAELYYMMGLSNPNLQ